MFQEKREAAMAVEAADFAAQAGLAASLWFWLLRCAADRLVR
jgi:hypothetical protein